jgi:formylglycine-generating enzyme required for sulfatase activity
MLNFSRRQPHSGAGVLGQTAKTLAVWLVCVACALGAGNVSAKAEPRIALVIGNGAYNPTLGGLANPVNDATSIAAALRRVGFDVDLETNLNQIAMKRAIARLGQRLRKAGSGATGLFYYAGHGLQEQGENYLVPIDADIQSEGDIDIYAVAAKGVLDQMTVAGDAVNIVILDACRNTPVLRARRSADRGLARMDAPTGSFIAYSTAPGQTAADGTIGGNSPFAAALASELTRPGEPIDDLFIRVRKSVLASTHNTQTPWDSSSLVDRFYFVPPKQLAAPAETEPPQQQIALAQTPPQTMRLQPGQSFRDCSDVCPEMVVIPPGRFTMGSPDSEVGRYPDEGPQHQVSIGYSFAVGKYAVTFAEWDACVADGGCNGYQPNDQGWGRSDHPVINVNWDDAQSYVRWLTSKTGHSYRLLSEAEYEYAARAGTTAPYYWGTDAGSGHTNCLGCGGQWSGRQTAPVGSFAPNAFGLYDMLGNVGQWTQDCYADTYGDAPSDGGASMRGDCSRHVLRGGSWFSVPRGIRSALRGSVPATIRSGAYGFRVARTY